MRKSLCRLPSDRSGGSLSLTAYNGVAAVRGHLDLGLGNLGSLCSLRSIRGGNLGSLLDLYRLTTGYQSLQLGRLLLQAHLGSTASSSQL